MSKYLIIYNPAAGRGRAGKLLPSVEECFKSNKLPYDLVLTTHQSNAAEIVQNTDLHNYEGIIACGGDGTLFEIANGYFNNPDNGNIPIGVLPLGTGNSFARELDLETNKITDAVELIADNKIVDVDAGEFTSGEKKYYFLNILGLGFVTDVLETAIKFKSVGETAYTIGVLHKTLFLNSYKLEMELDGEKIEQDNILVEISNTRYTGGNFLMAPNAEFNDGLLDVTLLRNVSRRRLLSIFPKLFKGTHINENEVECYKAKEIKIYTSPNKSISPDGELIGITPIEIKCLPNALRMYGR